jgi:hypothetical protein
MTLIREKTTQCSVASLSILFISLTEAASGRNGHRLTHAQNAKAVNVSAT